MTMPEYDEECDCDLCKQIRNDNNAKRYRKGATLSDNKTTETVKKRYCVLQFKIVTMQDQQRILLRELEEL